MRRLLAAGLAIGWALTSLAGAQATAPADGLSAEAARLAAASLRRDAQDIEQSPAGSPSRAGRLVALANMAAELDGDHPDTLWLLRSIYAAQGRIEEESRVVAKLLRANPHDHRAGLLWLDLELLQRDTAEQRIQFLTDVAGDAGRPRALRAEAMVRHAGILEGQAHPDRALEAYRAALELDPYQPGALSGAVDLSEQAGPADQVRQLVGTVCGNPNAASAGWQLGVILGDVGLAEPSLEMFAFAWQVHLRQVQARAISERFVVQYANAMLDLGQAKQAVALLAPVVDNVADKLALRSLLLQAHRAAGQDDQARKVLEAMNAELADYKGLSRTDVDKANRLAWHYLMDAPDAKLALTYARQAATRAPDEPAVTLLLGAAELRSGDEKLIRQGLARLEDLQGKDIYATVFLAEHYFAAGSNEAGKQVLLRGLQLSRRGRAARMLLALADKHGIKVAPHADAAKVRQAYQKLDNAYLELGKAPGKYVQARLEVVSSPVKPGQPIRARFRLTNSAKVPLPLGSWGLLQPGVALTARLPGRDDVPTFDHLPMARPAWPRYLEPGKSVEATVRLDVGPLADYLTRRPVGDIRVEIDGTLDPVRRGNKTLSALPEVAVAPAPLVRQSMLAEPDGTDPADWKKAYVTMLRGVLAGLRGDDLPRQATAARQIGALLAWVHEIDQARLGPPVPLKGQVDRVLTLALVREALRHDRPVVRAEMLAGCLRIPVDADLLKLVLTRADDPSALVRMRLAELLGVSAAEATRTLQALSRDDNANVADMARAFLPARTPTRPSR